MFTLTSMIPRKSSGRSSTDSGNPPTDPDRRTFLEQLAGVAYVAASGKAFGLAPPLEAARSVQATPAVAQATLAASPGQVSLSSLRSLARRAICHRVGIGSDWVARLWIGSEERRRLAGEPILEAVDMDDPKEAQQIEPPNVGQFQIRTEYIDQRLAHAIRGGTKQIVIMGAGCDSRAERMSDILDPRHEGVNTRELLRDVKIIELDLPGTQEYKKRKVQERFFGFPPNLTFLPINFEVDNINNVLVKGGWDPNQKTFFIWEGVIYYLTQDAVLGTLRFISESAPGSAVVFDTKREKFISWLDANVDSPDRVPPKFRYVLSQERNRRATGEPWLFGIPEGQEESFFANVAKVPTVSGRLSAGLVLADQLRMDGEEAKKRFLRHQNGEVAFEIPKPDSRIPTQVGWMGEAVVPPRSR
jgi:methyltransferase (TIGR00027 family)